MELLRQHQKGQGRKALKKIMSKCTSIFICRKSFLLSIIRGEEKLYGDSTQNP